jgi:cellulose biosynthesis protein BcsE
MTASPSVWGALLGALRSWWSQRYKRLQVPHAATLGMLGLPAELQQLPVGSPALLLTQDEASAQVWEPLVLSELLAVGPVLLLAARAQDADALWQHQTLRQAYGAGRLRVALLLPEQQGRLRREGLELWAREVQRAGKGSVCVLDARALLAGASLAELHRLGGQLRNFAQQHPWPTVWMLPLARVGTLETSSPQPADGVQIAAAARSSSLGIDHIATLTHEATQPLLSLHSWDSPQGALFHMRYHLRQEADRLTYTGSCSHGEVPTLVQAPDADVVYTTTACVPSLGAVPPDWVVLPDWAAVEQATQQAVGATLLLDVGDPPQLDALCALVHRLRSSRPASTKIIVRETTGKLRANSEQALLHLGVTAVAYRELGFARLLRLIASCRPVVHTRRLEESLEQALATFIPIAARGYQSPATFEALAREMLQRSTSVSLMHTLVHLQLLPQIAHLDALQACRTLRDGDLITADAHGILVFFFACSSADVAQALSNMFTLPIDQLFAAQVVDSSEVGIATKLHQLREQAPRLPDYSAALESLAKVAQGATPVQRTDMTDIPHTLHSKIATNKEASIAYLVRENCQFNQNSLTSVSVRKRPIGQRVQHPVQAMV